jgi:hypothetical protein
MLVWALATAFVANVSAQFIATHTAKDSVAGVEILFGVEERRLGIEIAEIQGWDYITQVNFTWSVNPERLIWQQGQFRVISLHQGLFYGGYEKQLEFPPPRDELWEGFGHGDAVLLGEKLGPTLFGGGASDPFSGIVGVSHNGNTLWLPIVPIPEPGAWGAGLFLVSFATVQWLRRYQ